MPRFLQRSRCTGVDTDGDGLSDCDEVNTFHTDPSNRDTDGGGTWDGTEVSRGTNPIDPGIKDVGALFDRDGVKHFAPDGTMGNPESGDAELGERALQSMAAKSHWEGEIHALAAVIAGRISGKLVVENKLEVGATAVIHADIVAKSIAIAKGAVIDGAVTVTSGQPVVQFEEKRG